MEIKSLYVEDFQSHARTKVELAPAGGLTVIVGPTDSGKTALVRAARLVYYNVPLGIEYIRVGRNMATVAVEMSDGTKVARERSKSVNRYRIVRPDESPQVLEGFGLSVPQEVQQTTGVRTVAIGDTIDLALNLSEQLDGPFLGKSVSGPAKAKILGALAGTEEVDEAQRAVGLDLHRAGQDVGRLVDELLALDSKIIQYDYLPALADKIETLTQMLTEVKGLQSRLTALETCARQLLNIGSQRIHQLATLARWGGLLAAVSHVEYAESASQRRVSLCGYKASLASISAQRADQTTRLTRWAGLDAAETSYAEASDGHSRHARLEDLSDDLDSTTNGMAMCRFVIDRLHGLSKASDLVVMVTDDVDRLHTLNALRTRLFDLGPQMVDADNVLFRWRGLDDARDAMAPVPELRERLAGLTQASASLTALRQSRVVAEQDLSRHSKALTDAQSLYADVLVSMGKCPLCGSLVSPETISLHIKEVA